MSDDDAANLLGRLSDALSDASAALSPLITSLQADGKSDDAQTAVNTQARLLADSTKANALAVSVLASASLADVQNLQKVNDQIAAQVAQLAASESNVAHLVGMATAVGQVVAALSGAGTGIGLGKALSSLSGFFR